MTLIEATLLMYSLSISCNDNDTMCADGGYWQVSILTISPNLRNFRTSMISIEIKCQMCYYLVRCTHRTQIVLIILFFSLAHSVNNNYYNTDYRILCIPKYKTMLMR